MLFFLFISVSKAEGQADEIVSKMKKNLSKLETFKSDIKMMIDISYLDMLPKTGKIYYKSPGKTKVDIKGFNILPKQGTGLFIDQILNEGEISAIYVGEEKLDGKPHHILKILPISPDSDFVLTTIWVDNSKYTVSKAQSTTKSMGSFDIEFQYQKVDDIYLPNYMELSIQVGEFKLPKTVTGDTGRSSVMGDDEKKASKDTDPGKGTVKIWYNNIKVNVPIDDKIFAS